MSATSYAWLEDVTISAPAGEPARAIIADDSGPVARVTARVSEILVAAQRWYPHVDEAEIAALLGASASDVEGVLEHFGSLPRIQQAAKPAGWIVARSRFVIQLTILDPSRLMARAPWLAAVAASRLLNVFTWAFVALGGLALLLAVVDPSSSVHRTLSLSQYLWVFLALFLSTFAHEFAHGATLTGLGGRPRRLGVMIFYFVPAFYCDVSDAWRLSRSDRVRVALAGIQLQCALASAALFASAVVPPQIATPLALYGVLGYAYTLLNLIPLIRLDGYVALVGYLDRPNLRADAIRSAGRLIALRPSDDRSAPRDPAWLPLFGVLCLLFPVFVVAAATVAIDGFFASWGTLGAIITLGVFVIAALLGLSALGGGVQGLFRDARSKLYAVSLSTLLVALVVAAALYIPIPESANAAVIEKQGHIMLAVAAATASIGQGDDVELYPQGAIPGPAIGAARIESGSSRCSVPLSTITPLSGSSLRIAAQCYDLRLPAGSSVQLPAVGKIRSSSTPLEDVRFVIARLMPGRNELK